MILLDHRGKSRLDGRHLSATLPFVAHCNCIGFLYSARPGYRPHLLLSTKRVFSVYAAGRPCPHRGVGVSHRGSLDHLVGPLEKGWGNGETEGLGGLVVAVMFTMSYRVSGDHPLGISTLARGLGYSTLRRKIPRVHLVPLNVGLKGSNRVL